MRFWGNPEVACYLYLQDPWWSKLGPNPLTLPSFVTAHKFCLPFCRNKGQTTKIFDEEVGQFLLRPGSDTVLFTCRTVLNKFDFGATLTRHLIQTAHRVWSLSKVWQTLDRLSNLTLLPHQTKIGVPNWFRRRSFSALNLSVRFGGIGSWGPFLESPGNFTGPKLNIQIEI